LKNYIFTHVSLKSKKAKRLLIALSILFITLFTISIVYFAESYMIQPYSIYKNSRKLADIYAQIYYNTSVKPSLLYDYATTVNYSTVYLSLAERVDYIFKISWLIYNNASRGSVVNTNFTLEPRMTINTPTWSKSFNITPEIIRSKDFIIVKGFFNISELEELIKTIDSEVKVNSWRFDLNMTIHFNIKVSYSSGATASYELNPLLTLSFNNIYNLLTFTTSGLVASYTEDIQKTIENTINLPLGFKINVSNMRRTTTITTLTLGAMSIGLIYLTLKTHLTPLSESKRKFLRRIIRGKVDEHYFKIVIVENPYDFENIARKYDAPIIYSESEKKYYLVIGDIAYVYVET